MKTLNIEDGNQIIKNVRVGENVHLPSFINLYGCEIGKGTRVGPFVEIQKGVRVGENCKISSHSFLCEGVELGNFVFIGHGVMFTNDRRPGACNADGSLKGEGDWTLEYTWIEDFVSIGSGAVILPGLRIGEHASVGAGAVVTRDVAPHTIVAGNPARVMKK